MDIFAPILPDFLPLLLVTALPFESEVVLRNTAYYQIFHRGKTRLLGLAGRKIYLLETGMGNRLENKEIIRQIIGVQPALLINYGICGSLDPGLKIKSVFRIERVCCESGQTVQLSFPRVFSAPSDTAYFPIASLLTVEEPVLHESRRSQLFRNSGYPLVDMEGYFIAKLAESYSLPLVMIKVISDFANEKTVETVRRNKSAYQKVLRETLRVVLAGMSEE